MGSRLMKNGYHLYDHTIIFLRYQHDVVILSPVALRHAREFNLLACRLNHLLQHMLTFDISNCNQLGVLDVGLLELQQRFTINHPNAEWSSGGNIKIGFCRYGPYVSFFHDYRIIFTFTKSINDRVGIIFWIALFRNIFKSIILTDRRSASIGPNGNLSL